MECKPIISVCKICDEDYIQIDWPGENGVSVFLVSKADLVGVELRRRGFKYWEYDESFNKYRNTVTEALINAGWDKEHDKIRSKNKIIPKNDPSPTEEEKTMSKTEEKIIVRTSNEQDILDLCLEYSEEVYIDKSDPYIYAKLKNKATFIDFIAELLDLRYNFNLGINIKPLASSLKVKGRNNE